jgi:4-hydroxy-3-methylbut-2-enyl diphosphate reductase
MGRLLIAAPLRVEELLVRWGARGGSVHRTGMGPSHARVAARSLLDEPGDGLLVIGFCGGLDEESRPGEVIVADEVLSDLRPGEDAHGRQRRGCASPQGLVEVLEASGLRVRRGPVVCVSQLALGERRRELHEGGAIAVDMESVWLAEGAGDRPFDVVRVVLDSPSHELLRPGAVLGALRAGRALRRVAAALRDWAPARVGPSDSAAGSSGLHGGGPRV